MHWSTLIFFPWAPNIPPMAMFSLTLAEPNGRGIWKVLPIPRGALL